MVFDYAELFETQTEPKKVFSYDDLFTPRKVFSADELFETQKELLAKAQEKVKYKFTPEEIKARKEADSPSKWSAETWSAVGETMRELPAAQLFSKEFWSESGKKLVKQSLEMLHEETLGRQRRWGMRAFRTLAPLGQYAGLVPPTGERPVVEAGKEVAKSAVDYALFIPKTLFNVAKDPIGTMREQPLDVLTLVAAVAGVKVAKGIKAKSAAKKWVTTGDFIEPIVESKMVSKQLKTRLLEVPSDIEFEIPTEPLEIIKFKKNGKMPVFKHWWEGFKKDLKQTGDLPDRPTKYHPKYGLRIPLRTFEQYPWLKKLLYDEWRAGEYNALIEHLDFKGELKAWRKKLPRKSQERVGVYADYMQEGGKEIMQYMKQRARKKGLSGKKYDMPDLTPLESEYYNWGQQVFSDFLPRLNQIRALAGEKPIGKVQNYSTWIRNMNELADLGLDITKASAEQLDFHLNSLPLSMAKSRAKGLIRAGLELDYGLLLENYSQKAGRTIHISPAVIKGRAFLEPFIKQNWHMMEKAPRLATWLTEWIDTIAGQKRGIPAGKAGIPVKALNILNKNIAMAILSFNVRSALIQPSAFKLSYTVLGEKFFVEGFRKNMVSKAARQLADAKSQHLIMRKQGMYDVHAALMRQPQVGKKLAGTKATIAQAGMFPLQWLDYQTARATWIGAYEMAVKKLGMKKGSKRAFTHADDVIVRTQASAQIGDIAPIQRTPFGRFMTLFQTFVINEWDMLTHDVMGYRNPYMNMAQKSQNIGRFVLGSAVVNAVYEGIFKIRSPYPAPEWAYYKGVTEGQAGLQIAGEMTKEMLEQLPLIGGTIRWSTPYRVAHTAGLATVLFDPLQMVNRLLTKPSITGDQLEWIGKVIGLPGTSQVRKYIRRRKRGQTHLEAVLGVRAEGGGKKKEPSW